MCSAMIKKKEHSLSLTLFDMLPFSIWPFQSQVSAAATALFNLYANHRTVFSSPDENDVHLIG